jgi:broad specificity phosphatase PhoE
MRRSRRSTALLLTAGLCAVAACTACSAPGPAYDAFLRSADTFANQTAGPVLEEYLEADQTLDPASRSIHLGEIAAFRDAVAAAKAERAQP